jgi:pSer/pThr/pTyr-binding forkhead associated (FHA) protein
MAKLILSVDGTVLKEYSLTKERITIGRKPHNDIQVDNLAVSGEHAAIITILNDSFIEDLNSTNGTLVNGKPVKKHFLQHNDVIEIGKHKLKYFNDKPLAADTSDFEKTMIIRKPSAPVQAPAAVPAAAPLQVGYAPRIWDTQTNIKTIPQTPPPVVPAPPSPSATPAAPAAPSPSATPTAPAAAFAPGREATIQVLSGAAAGRTLDLIKNLTTIGKPGTQVAVITRRPAGFFITHVEGANFPSLNGVPLGGQAHQLNDHDLVEIAGVKMEFFYKP